MLESFVDSFLSDLMEDYSLVCLFFTDGLGQMPGDRFSFAVRICCEIDAFGSLSGFLEVIYVGSLLFGDDVLRRERILDIDAHGALGKITDVTFGCGDDISFGKHLGEGVGLRRRLYDHQIVFRCHFQRGLFLCGCSFLSGSSFGGSCLFGSGLFCCSSHFLVSLEDFFY